MDRKALRYSTASLCVTLHQERRPAWLFNVFLGVPQSDRQQIHCYLVIEIGRHWEKHNNLTARSINHCIPRLSRIHKRSQEMPNGGRSNGNSKKKDGGQMENVSGKIGVVEFCEKRAMSFGIVVRRILRHFCTEIITLQWSHHDTEMELCHKINLISATSVLTSACVNFL